MIKLVTLITENIFAVLGFTLYCGLVYYMLKKVFRKYAGRHLKKKKSGRRDFSKSFPAARTFTDNDQFQG